MEDNFSLNEDETGFSGAKTQFKRDSVDNFKPSGSREFTPLQERIPSRNGVFSAGAGHLDNFRNIVLVFALFSFGITIALVVQVATGDPQIAPHGGVATSAEICSDLGVEILKRGGNAVDAAITSMLCVGVVNPQYAGLGGGGFMLIHDHKSHSSKVLDFREVSPFKVDLTGYQEKADWRLGGKAVGIPGELLGMKKAHDDYGVLSWADLFQPVIRLAQTGFNLTATFVKSVEKRGKISGRDAEEMERFTTAFARDFTNGQPLVAGVWVKRPDLGHLLQQLSKPDGVERFYQRDLAEEIVDAIYQRGGGLATLDDFRNYRVVVRQPVISTFKGLTVESCPSPASGSLMSLMLSVLDSKEFKPEDFGTAEYYRYFGEVIIQVMQLRSHFGDPKGSVDIEQFEEEMLNSTFVEELKQKISAIIAGVAGVTVGPSVSPQDFFDDRMGTSHVSVIDKNDLMVAVTHSINDWFGSLVVTKSGLLLNNHIADFDWTGQATVNKMAPSKRPFSSMSPTVVYNPVKSCAKRFAIGGINGIRIFSGVAEVITNIVAFGKDLSEAVDSPLSQSVSTALIGSLSSLGMNVTLMPHQPNYINVVMKANDTIAAYSDPGNNGKATIY